MIEDDFSFALFCSCSHFCQCPDTACTDFNRLAIKFPGLQIDMLTFQGLDVGMGTACVLGCAAIAGITSFRHRYIYLITIGFTIS